MSNKFDFIDDINNNLTKTATNQIQTTIFNLNDDCLSEIFKYVDFREWTYLSKISERFYQIIISRLLKGNAINLRSIRDKCNVRKVLRLFGPFASHIVAASSDIQYTSRKYSHSDELVFLLGKRCNKDILRSLTLSLDISAVSLDSCQLLAHKLTSIESFSIRWVKSYFPPINSRGNEDILLVELLKQSKNLRSIEFINIRITSELFQSVNCDNLQSISFEACPVIEISHFEKAMAKIGKQLIKFEWKNSTFADRYVCETILDLTNIISRYAPNLIEIELQMNYNSPYCQKFAK